MTFRINGASGKYDSIVSDEGVRYGRNAVENNTRYMESPLVNDRVTAAPILNFTPSINNDEQNISKLNKFIDENDLYLKSLPPLEFEYRYMPNFVNSNFKAEPLDINNDGKIDVAEYGANIMASDILSKDTPDVTKADGTINSKGMNAILEYTKKSNAAAAAKLYSNIYKTYDLGSELSEFKPE